MNSTVTALPLETVLYEKSGAIAYVTLNRPKVLNALNKMAIADLRTAFEDARDDAAVMGVILTGAGEKAFIAGADVAEPERDGDQRIGTNRLPTTPCASADSMYSKNAFSAPACRRGRCSTASRFIRTAIYGNGAIGGSSTITRPANA